MVKPNPLPKVWRTVRWPVLVSIIVVLVRLIGELMAWDPRLFGTAVGGGFSLVGVSWLMPIFGFAFGWILTGKGHAPDRPGLAIILHLLGLALLIAGVIAVQKNVDHPAMLGALAGVAVVSLLFAWRGWSELIRYTFTYGLMVRLAVIAVTAVAFQMQWGTHFESLPEQYADRPSSERFLSLVAPQLFFWIPGTVLVGGVFGSIATFIRGRRPDDAPDD
jgi:hypothetical protein